MDTLTAKLMKVRRFLADTGKVLAVVAPFFGTAWALGRAAVRWNLSSGGWLFVYGLLMTTWVYMLWQSRYESFRRVFLFSILGVVAGLVVATLIVWSACGFFEPAPVGCPRWPRPNL